MGSDVRSLCFFECEICGECVVSAWFLYGFLLVKNDTDKDWGECA